MKNTDDSSKLLRSFDPLMSEPQIHRQTFKNNTQKLDLVVRLSRIEGQIRGIKGMIERDVCCDDVLNQVSAVQSALYSVGRLLLSDHIRTCMAEKIKNNDTRAIDDLLISINRLSSLNYK